MTSKKLAILVPAYNEEKTVGSLVISAKKYGIVIVADDGSIDRTAEVAKAAGAEVVTHQKNMGYGAALKTLAQAGLATGADVFVFIDADYQHDPEEIAKVAAPVLSGTADVCVGSRFLGKMVNQPAYRKEGVRLLNGISKIRAGGKEAVDFQCGFRAFSRQALEGARINEDGYGGGAEMLALAIRNGAKVVQVPVTIRYYGKRGIGFAQGAGLLGGLVEKMAKRKPLVFFGGAGLLLLLASGALGIFVARTFYASGVLPFGSAFLTVFSGVAGLILILIGINLYTLEAILEKR
ncbi:MAG: glycosyltransferase family 2 protein [Candidatus Anstonellaceae archaeon]